MRNVGRNSPAGEVPTSIPSLSTFESVCRLIIFELAFDNLVAQVNLDERTKEGLWANRSGLREQFELGEAKAVLKVAARPLADPLIDDAIKPGPGGAGRSGPSGPDPPARCLERRLYRGGAPL